MKIVEFAGTICAGKMTLLGEVKSRLKSACPDWIVRGVVEDIRIRSEVAHPENYLERQILITGRTMNELIEFRDFGGPDLVLVHRGLWDAQAFMAGYVKANLVPPARARPQIAAWEANAKSLTDFVILVKTPVEVAFQRAKKKFATLFQLKDRDAVLEQKFFEVLDQAYEELERKLPSKSSLVVDGSKPIKENRERILEAIAQLLKPEKGLTPEANSKEGGAGWRIMEKSLTKKMALT